MSWLDYWNGETSIYVSPRHKQAHYAAIARDLVRLIATTSAGTGTEAEPGMGIGSRSAPATAAGAGLRVLDFGCGEALSAPEVARACGHLYLCDGAPSVRDGIARRTGAIANITVLSPDDMAALPTGSLDLVVANSVLQYLDRATLDGLLATWKRLLSARGRLVLADVIPPDVSPITDATALLRLAAANGFLGAALVGLVRTFFSDYRKKRAELGLSQYREDEMLALLEAAGYRAIRLHPNMGHNQSRMAFEARASVG